MISVMSLFASFLAERGKAESLLSGILTTYWLSLAIAVAALIMTVVCVKKSGRKSAAKASTDELEAAMMSEPYTVSYKDTLDRVMMKFIDYRTRGLPVVDSENHIMGFVSDGDVLRHMSKHDVLFESDSYTLVLPDDEGFSAKARHLLSKNVMEIASKHVISVTRDTSLVEVCRLFSEKGLNKLLVTQDDVLVGTISRGDIIRMLMMRLPLGEHV
jgi:CBS domain-containing protein